MSENNGLTCVICLADFENTPKEHIYHPKCPCGISIAYHPRCINDLREDTLHPLQCPQCKKQFLKKDIDDFLLKVVSSETNSQRDVPKPPKCLQLTNKILNIFRPVYNYCLKGGVNGQDNIKVIQPLMNLMFVIWFIYLHVMIHEIYTDKYNDIKHDCSQNITNTTDNSCNYAYDYRARHYSMSFFFGIFYIVVCYSVNNTFYGNVLEYAVFTLIMIIECAIWEPLVDKGYNDFTIYPGLFLLILSVISLLVCLGLIIILRSIEEFNNKYKFLPEKITSFIGYHFKTGDDYDEEAEQRNKKSSKIKKQKETEHINVEPDTYTTIDID